MRKVDWDYSIDIKFDVHSSKPSGIRMYFSDFKIAVERMMTFEKIIARDDPVYEMLAKDRSIKEMKLLSMADGSVEMERRLESDGFADRAPGLYYHFPKGITNFEKKSGLSFVGYKGYDKRNAFIQTSYLNSNGTSYQDIIAHQMMLKNQEGERKDNQYMSAAITRYYFESVFPDQMLFHQEPLSEVYIHTDPNVAMKMLLGLDFNQLDSSVAYETELENFISDAKITGYYSSYKATLSSHRKVTGDYHRRTPGIYLDMFFPSEDKERIDFPKNFLEPLDQYKSLYKVGVYNELGTMAEKVPELLYFLSETEQEKRLKGNDQRPKKRASLKGTTIKI